MIATHGTGKAEIAELLRKLADVVEQSRDTVSLDAMKETVTGGLGYQVLTGRSSHILRINGGALSDELKNIHAATEPKRGD